MNIKSRILKYKDDDSPLGDLARDVASDESFPDTESIEVVQEYLGERGMCDGAKLTMDILNRKCVIGGEIKYVKYDARRKIRNST